MTTLASIELLGSIQTISYISAIGTPGESLITGSLYWDQVCIGGPLLVILAGVRAFDVKYVHGMTALILLAVLASFIFGFVGLFLTLGTWRGNLGQVPGVTGLNLTTFLDNALPSFALPTSFSDAQLESFFQTNTQMVESTQVAGSAVTLSLLFPTFLGIFQGANKAPELKTPNASVFKGTIGALLTSLTIYVLIFLLVSGVATRDVLKSDPLLFANLTWPTQYVGLVGVVLVGIGACVSLLEIGPTILQAVAEDGLYSFLQRLNLHVKTDSGEPVYAVLVSFCLNFMLLFVSSAYFEDLAAVVTMFFLQAYAQMHLALLLNELQKHQSWRPTFPHYHISTAAVGFCVTLVLMFLVSYIQALVTLLLAVILLAFVKVVEEPRRKGLGTRSLEQGRALGALYVDEEITHRDKAKEGEQNDQDAFWEPQIMCILDQVQSPSNPKVLYLAEHLSRRGLYPRLTMVTSVLQASHSARTTIARHRLEHQLFRLCQQVNLRAFPQAIVCPESCSVSDAYLLAMQSSGLAALKPNLVLIDWQNPNILELIRHARLTEKVITMLKDDVPLEHKHRLKFEKQKGKLGKQHSIKKLRGKGWGGLGTLFTFHGKNGEEEEEEEEGGGGEREGERGEGEKKHTRNANNDDIDRVSVNIADCEPAENNEEDDDDEEEDDDEDEEDDQLLQADTMEDVDEIFDNRRRRAKRSMLVARSGTIDVWWVVKNGGLPVLLGKLLTAHRVYRKCRLRVFTVIEGTKISDIITAKATLMVERMLEQMRIHAFVEVIQVDPATNHVVRTTAIDEEYHLDQDFFEVGTVSYETLRVILENDFDEDDERPVRFSSRAKAAASVFDIFPELREEPNTPAEGEVDAVSSTRRLKAKAVRAKALALYHSLLVEHSSDAELVILNLPLPPKRATFEMYQETLRNLTESIPRVLFVHSCLDDDELTARIQH